MYIAGFLGGFEWILILFFVLLPVFALISIIRNEFEGNNKLLWVIVVIFIPYLGSILYFLIGRNQKLRR
ncbi:MAG: PLDc N-terminal domain-containing protein [Bacteroidales bacterium]|nr:PLDc N-terminal domain-containing protein [Bacteroidales bacterium]